MYFLLKCLNGSCEIGIVFFVISVEILTIAINFKQVIGNQLSQYGSSTFYKGLTFKIPTNVKPASVDVKNATKTNDCFEDEEKHQPER